MVFIISIIGALIIIGILYFLRSSGRMQPPGAKERMRHNESASESKSRPRSTGLD